MQLVLFQNVSKIVPNDLVLLGIGLNIISIRAMPTSTFTAIAAF